MSSSLHGVKIIPTSWALLKCQIQSATKSHYELRHWKLQSVLPMFFTMNSYFDYHQLNLPPLHFNTWWASNTFLKLILLYSVLKHSADLTFVFYCVLTGNREKIWQESPMAKGKSKMDASLEGLRVAQWLWFGACGNHRQISSAGFSSYKSAVTWRLESKYQKRSDSDKMPSSLSGCLQLFE